MSCQQPVRFWQLGTQRWSKYTIPIEVGRIRIIIFIGICMIRPSRWIPTPQAWNAVADKNSPVWTASCMHDFVYPWYFMVGTGLIPGYIFGGFLLDCIVLFQGAWCRRSTDGHNQVHFHPLRVIMFYHSFWFRRAPRGRVRHNWNLLCLAPVWSIWSLQSFYVCESALQFHQPWFGTTSHALFVEKAAGK